MDLRSELLRDAQKLKGRAFDCLSGVFLTGDIAFAGKTVEFTSARDWLDQIRAEFAFPQGAVWCVPGNHDVDRTIVAASRNRQRTRESIRRGGEAQAAQELHELLKDDISNTILLEPLRAFNESFAAGFQCTTRFPELCWSDTIPLGDRYQLVLTGLNSAVISDGNDDDDQGRLVLGLHQIHSVRRRSGDIHVSLCHHPPRWLLDRSDVEAFLNSRTTLQLFGRARSAVAERARPVADGLSLATRGGLNGSRTAGRIVVGARACNRQGSPFPCRWAWRPECRVQQRQRSEGSARACSASQGAADRGLPCAAIGAPRRDGHAPVGNVRSPEVTPGTAPTSDHRT